MVIAAVVLAAAAALAAAVVLVVVVMVAVKNVDSWPEWVFVSPFGLAKKALYLYKKYKHVSELDHPQTHLRKFQILIFSH